MKETIRIALIGDYSPKVRAHQAIPVALELASKLSGCAVTPTWTHTASLGKVQDQLSTYDGIWCVPASPYANMDGALRAINYARENHRPFLGTCGGFQHALIEYARNVLGLPDADHAESNPEAKLCLISRLSCSLVGVRGKIFLKPESKCARIYEQTHAEEEFHCNYGVNRECHALLERGDLGISGTDESGEIRAIELSSHAFFIATLFQPELSALSGKAHPLVAAFVRTLAGI